MSTAEERFENYSTMRIVSAEEVCADAERYRPAWRAGKASVSSSTPGFPT